MVTVADYPVALVSNGRNTRITIRTSTTPQSTNMKGDRNSPGIDIPPQAGKRYAA